MADRFTTTPEPWGDIRAQLKALTDPKHPKDTVYLPGEDGDGILATTDPQKAFIAWTKPELTEDDLAKFLGYPQSKGDVLEDVASGDAAHVVQARDGDGYVVHESVTSLSRMPHTTKAMLRYVPDGGDLYIADPLEALKRRHEMNGDGR